MNLGPLHGGAGHLSHWTVREPQSGSSTLSHIATLAPAPESQHEGDPPASTLPSSTYPKFPHSCKRGKKDRKHTCWLEDGIREHSVKTDS